MASTVARGSITILDYNDAISLNSYIGSNQPLTQIYSPDTQQFTPNWSTGPYLKLTPEVFESSDNTDIMIAGTGVQSVTWTSNGVPITLDANHVQNPSAPFDLTIKINELSSVAQKNYECTVVWTDPKSTLDLTAKCAISFAKVTNAGSVLTAISYGPQGTIFKNGNTATLIAHCDLWRGAAIDTTNVQYDWFYQTMGIFAPTTLTSSITSGTDTAIVASTLDMMPGSEVTIDSETLIIASVNTSSKTITMTTDWTSDHSSAVTVSNPSYDSRVGVGWAHIDDTHTFNGLSNYNTDEMTIPNAAILDYAVYQCACKDTDPSSPTYNQSVYDIISFADLSDPIQIEFDTPAGTVLKNGQGSLTITARLWQALTEIDTLGTKYTYTWYRYDKDGNIDNTYGGVGYKTGKTLNVGGTDVSAKATFQCTISTPS